MGQPYLLLPGRRSQHHRPPSSPPIPGSVVSRSHASSLPVGPMSVEYLEQKHSPASVLAEGPWVVSYLRLLHLSVGQGSRGEEVSLGAEAAGTLRKVSDLLYFCGCPPASTKGHLQTQGLIPPPESLGQQARGFRLAGISEVSVQPACCEPSCHSADTANPAAPPHRSCDGFFLCKFLISVYPSLPH